MKYTILFLSLAQVANAGTVSLSPKDDWFAVLNGAGLTPGDEVVLSAGVYSDARRLEMKHAGTAEKPITIRGLEGAVLKRPDAQQNTINMAGCQHLILRGLEITGGDAAIRIYKDGERQAGFLTFENLHIHDTSGVAVTANNDGCIYEQLVFRHNEIHHTGAHGEGFYLGGNNDAEGATGGYVFNSIVEENYIHDLNGENISQGDGIEIKDGSYGNIIRKNVIHDTKYPGITVYGTDGKARNIIEDNVIWNTGDNGIQAAADAEIRGNVIFDPGNDGIHCRAHQSAVPGNLTITKNTIVKQKGAGGSWVRVSPPLSGSVDLTENVFIGISDLRIPSGDPKMKADKNTETKDLPEGYPESWVSKFQRQIKSTIEPKSGSKRRL